MLLNVVDKILFSTALALGGELQIVQVGDYYLAISEPPALILAIAILVLLLRQIASDRRDRQRLVGEM